MTYLNMQTNIVKRHFFSLLLKKGKKNAFFFLRGKKDAIHSMKGQAGRNAHLKQSGGQTLLLPLNTSQLTVHEVAIN